MAYAWNMSLSNDQSLPEAKRKDRKDESINILKTGIEANPSRYVQWAFLVSFAIRTANSFLLNFAYAEVLESNKSLEEVHSIFEKFLGVLRKDLDALESRVSSGNTSNSINATQQSQRGMNDETSELLHSGFTQNSSQNSSMNSQNSDERPPKNKELSDRRTEYGVAWIVYMRFARRAENLKAARTVFGKARKDHWTPWEVYEAAGMSWRVHTLSVLTRQPLALMEYHCTKATDVATRIFEKGLENFSEESEFALRYLGFLISINDDSSEYLIVNSRAAPQYGAQMHELCLSV